MEVGVREEVKAVGGGGEGGGDGGGDGGGGEGDGGGGEGGEVCSDNHRRTETHDVMPRYRQSISKVFINCIGNDIESRVSITHFQ